MQIENLGQVYCESWSYIPRKTKCAHCTVIFVYIIYYIYKNIIFLFKQMGELKIILIFRRNNLLFDTYRLPIENVKP